MPDFNPDAFLARTAPAGGGKFDPDAFLARTAPPAPKERMSAPESAISAVAKGLTFGRSDEIIGTARAAGAKALDAIGVGGFEKPFGELRDKYVGEQRGHIATARADNPHVFTIGEIAGSVASPVNKVLGPVKGAKFLANTGKAIAGGVLSGTGESEHNPLESPDEMINYGIDGVKGGLVGGTTSVALGALGKFVSGFKPGTARKWANEKAVSAAGGMSKELRELGPEGVQDLGSRLLKDKVVTAGVSLDEVAERAAAQKEVSGKAIGAALENVDDLVATGKQLIDSGHLFPGSSPKAKESMKGMLDKQFQFNMKNIGDRIEKELIEPNERNPFLKGEVAKLRSLAEGFRAEATQTLKEGNIIKGTQGRLTNFDSDTVPNAFKKEAYGIIKTELDNIVAKTGNLEHGIAQAQKAQGVGVPQITSGGIAAPGGAAPLGAAAGARNQSASDAYQEAKKAYGAYSDAEDMALKSLGRTNANRTIGLSDIITGTAAAASGGPLTGLVVGGASKAVRKYGDSTGAVALDKLANTLERSPAAVGAAARALDAVIEKGRIPAANLIIDKMQQKRDAIQRRIGN